MDIADKLQSMTTTAMHLSFAARLREVCDDMKLPEHGRQTQLANQFNVTQGAARKWLSGEGYPVVEKIVQICEWSGTNVNWLIMGVGPKRTDKIDTKVLVLGEAIESLKNGDRQQVLDFISYKFERNADFFAGERLARYMAMIDAFKKDRKNLK